MKLEAWSGFCCFSRNAHYNIPKLCEINKNLMELLRQYQFKSNFLFTNFVFKIKIRLVQKVIFFNSILYQAVTSFVLT